MRVCDAGSAAEDGGGGGRAGRRQRQSERMAREVSDEAAARGNLFDAPSIPVSLPHLAAPNEQRNSALLVFVFGPLFFLCMRGETLAPLFFPLFLFDSARDQPAVRRAHANEVTS